MHGTVNPSGMWGTVQRQMLKFECPIKVRGWAGEERYRAGLGRPGNVETEQIKWGRVSKEGRWSGGWSTEENSTRKKWLTLFTAPTEKRGRVRIGLNFLKGVLKIAVAAGAPIMPGGFQLGWWAWMEFPSVSWERTQVREER